MSLVICILIIAGTGLSWHWLWLAVPVHILSGLAAHYRHVNVQISIARLRRAVSNALQAL